VWCLGWREHKGNDLFDERFKQQGVIEAFLLIAKGPPGLAQFFDLNDGV